MGIVGRRNGRGRWWWWEFCFGIAMIMMQVKSPMLVAVGMYLPFGTTFAIFVGGVFRAVGRLDRRAPRLQQRSKSTSGKCRSAGRVRTDRRRSLVGPGVGGDCSLSRSWGAPNHPPQIFSTPSYLVGGMIVLAGLAALMIFLPVTAAGDPNEPAPPTAIM